MSGPLTFIYGNCVFARDLDDVWAAFALELSSYAWLGDDAKRARFLELVGALEAVEADVQILRVCRRWDPDRYVATLQEHGHERPQGARARAQAWRRYVEEQAGRLDGVGTAQPVAFLLVSLSEPERDVASYVSRAAAQSPREWWHAIRRGLSLRDRRMLSLAQLERARVRADQAHARLAAFVPVREARGVELQWLVRRAFCRGLGEPQVDDLHEPRALMFERNGEAMLAPLEADVMRWGSLVPFSWFLFLPNFWLWHWNFVSTLRLGVPSSRD